MFSLNLKLKLICILCFVLSSFLVLIAYFNPAHGYELSLYECTPSIIWIGLVVSIIGGVYINVYIIYRHFSECYYFCFLGFFILLFNRVILLSIPYIRGYYSWRGDNVSHLGILKDIFLSGHVASDNIYPITHLLLSEIIYVTGLPIELIVNHATTLLSIFYIISIYMLATSALNTKKEQIFAVTAVACVTFNGYDVYLMPNGWSLLYLPIVLFFYFKSSVKKHSLRYTILFTISLIIYPFFHPLSTVILIMMLIIIGCIEYLFFKIIDGDSFATKVSPLPVTPILLETVIFLPWLLSFQQFNLNIKLMYNSITIGSSPDVIASMGETLGKLDLSVLQFIILFIKVMGSELIFLLLLLISIAILVKSPNARKNKYLIIIVSITSVIGLMYAAYLFNIIPGLQSMGSERLQAYLVIFTPISAGFVLSSIIDNKIRVNKFNLAPVICIIIILTASILSIFSLYPSPYVIEPNPSITQMDIKGTSWILNSKSISFNGVFIMSPLYRFAAGVSGLNESEMLLGPRYLETAVPDHFNYSVSKNLGDSFTKDKYCMITMFDKIIYTTVWNTVGRFNLTDFMRLEKDSTVYKLYSNGECEVWYIHKI